MAANRGVAWRHWAVEDKPASPQTQQLSPGLLAPEREQRCLQPLLSQQEPPCQLQPGFWRNTSALSLCQEQPLLPHEALRWTSGSSHTETLRHEVGWGLLRTVQGAECASCFPDQQCELLHPVSCAAVPEPAVLPEEGYAPLLRLRAAPPCRWVPGLWEDQTGCQSTQHETFGGSQWPKHRENLGGQPSSQVCLKPAAHGSCQL